eukprot:101446_1
MAMAIKRHLPIRRIVLILILCGIITLITNISRTNTSNNQFTIPDEFELFDPTQVWVCEDLYIDLGSNIGVQTRKLFEPQHYPNATVLRFFDLLYGNVSVRRTGVCSFGFEPNPRHHYRLNNIEKCYNSQGWKTKFYHNAVFVRDNENIIFYSDEDTEHEEWGAGISMNWDNQSRSENSKYNVRTIDIARFIKDIVTKYNAKHVFVKMDIEGAEWPVIPHLFHNGILCKKYIDGIAIEIHNQAKKEMKGNWTLESLRDDLLNRSPLDCDPTDIIALDDETYLHDNVTSLPHICNV